MTRDVGRPKSLESPEEPGSDEAAATGGRVGDEVSVDDSSVRDGPDPEQLRSRLDDRTEQVLESELDEAVAAMEAAEGALTPTKQRGLARLAARIADRTVAPAEAGLTSTHPDLRARTADLFDLQE